jgi:hypothetical protein
MGIRVKDISGHGTLGEASPRYRRVTRELNLCGLSELSGQPRLANCGSRAPLRDVEHQPKSGESCVPCCRIRRIGIRAALPAARGLGPALYLPPARAGPARLDDEDQGPRRKGPWSLGRIDGSGHRRAPAMVQPSK